MQVEYPRVAEWFVNSWAGWFYLLAGSIWVLTIVYEFLRWICSIIAESFVSSETKTAQKCPCCGSRHEHDCCCGCFPACRRTCYQCGACTAHCKCVIGETESYLRTTGGTVGGAKMHRKELDGLLGNCEMECAVEIMLQKSEVTKIPFERLWMKRADFQGSDLIGFRLLIDANCFRPGYPNGYFWPNERLIGIMRERLSWAQMPNPPSSEERYFKYRRELAADTMRIIFQR